MKLPQKIILGLIVGVLLGLACHVLGVETAWVDAAVKNVARPMGQIFLRLLFMVVVPLVFSSLVLGVYEIGDFKSLGRVGLKTLLYSVVASIVSVAIGIALVTAAQPGRGLSESLKQQEGFTSSTLSTEQSKTIISQASSASSVSDIVVSLIPKNPVAAAANALEGDMVALMIFALLFGAALVLARPRDPANDHVPKDSLVKMFETLRDVSMKIVDFAMALAPFGVAALTFAMTAKFGWRLLVSLGLYVAVVVVGLLIQQLLFYSILLKGIAKRSPIKFLQDIREVIITAFSTASSNATLPTTIRVAREQLGLKPHIANFVLTIGSTANQNGTALFEGVTILFLAQVFGVELTFSQQLTAMFMSVIAGIGTAGVPGGSLPLIVIVLQSVGVPAEGIGLVLGVDRFLDMCRTVLNVSGDLVAATVIDATEAA